MGSNNPVPVCVLANMEDVSRTEPYRRGIPMLAFLPSWRSSPANCWLLQGPPTKARSRLRLTEENLRYRTVWKRRKKENESVHINPTGPMHSSHLETENPIFERTPESPPRVALFVTRSPPINCFDPFGLARLLQLEDEHQE
jgi:hypothetical protein